MKPSTTVLITGANSGIGRATAQELAAQGATVLMACRNRERGVAALSAVKRATGNDRIELFLADLAVQGEVRALAAEVKERYDRLDVLINNAGVYLAEKATTPAGIEKTFAVNHLASFLLTNLLLGRLEATAVETGEARILTVASEMHRDAALDLDYHRDGSDHYGGKNAYAQSKLANVLFTYALARRLKSTGVTANAVHPGVVSTRIWNRNRDVWSLLARLTKPFMTRPATSAEALTYLATSPELQGVTGKYFKLKKETRSSERSYDRDLAEALWQMSAELTGLRDA